MTGSILHYELVGTLGAGGMGVVYKARDTRLQRYVALKFLPPQVGPHGVERERFLQEARAASALDHPNICTIHDIETAEDGRTFLVMACYEGETLQARLRRGAMPVLEALAVGRQLANGLGRAHELGIVHRDVKPSNIFLTTDGTVKVLDFGVAKLVDETHLEITRAGTTIGTVGYMSPEQVRGEPADARADVWAIGVTLYEMLTGARAFDGSNTHLILNAIEVREPAPLEQVRPDVPADVAAVVRRALQKDPAQRYAGARAMAEALDAIEARLRGSAAGRSALPPLRRPAVAIPLAALVLALVTATGWLWYRTNRSSWARNEALPAIAKLAAERRYDEAVALAERAEPYLSGDPQLQQLWADIAVTIRIESNPAGAQIEFRPYADRTGAWRILGTTPLDSARIARGAWRWRFSAPGADTIERAAPAMPGVLRVDLPPAGSVPEGFVRVTRSSEVLMLAGYGLPQELMLGDFLIQKHEVTNRDYKKFVDAGGYRRREFWKHPFTDAAQSLTWDAAMARFVDKAGQPGPATWEVGAYAAGQDEMPVGGLSWFEAAAYAEFAGLRLPTMAHWYRAAGMTSAPYQVPLSNFDYRGPIPVRESAAMSPSGAYDMAGNVKEWVWNANAGGDRYILGGGWGEPSYMFGDVEARSPFDRAPQNGVRCVKYGGDGMPEANTVAPLNRLQRDYRREAPVPDDLFATFVRLHEYERTPLTATIEKTIDTNPDTRVERVSFPAAYPGQRVIAYVWLPKGVKPPYQTLILFPGAEALRLTGSDVLEQPDRYDFLVRSGRAVVHPIYHGMYERFAPRVSNAVAWRNMAVRWAQDLRRTIDYLETRGDIDRSKIAYFGSSLGGGFAPVPLALEPRLRLAVLLGAGLPAFRQDPEVEPVNFAPRVKQPLLMVTGRYDYFIPYDPAQTTFFSLIGTDPAHKKHVVVDAPHSVPRSEYLREVLGWLDKYFGPAR